jgi:uncharacterized protein (TIGR03435 family)
MTVREMIRDAYGFRNRAASDVVGGWIDSERYDLQARAGVELPPAGIVGLPSSVEPYLRALLAERMKLKVRIEAQRRRVYELVLARDDGRLGPGLTPAKGGCRNFYEASTPVIIKVVDGQKLEPPPPPCPFTLTNAAFAAGNLTMAEFTRFMPAFPQIDATVIDKTGLAGAYDISVTNPSFSDPGGNDLLPALAPIFERQLGLRMRRAEAPVDVLIIESVERPSEN